jgi:hypothetical protein
MLWLGFIEIDKIMKKLKYFFGPHCGTASIALRCGQYYTD